ncbi:MAG: hypothetical protein WDN26_00970 [Chitinophagaceae bacterium]
MLNNEQEVEQERRNEADSPRDAVHSNAAGQQIKMPEKPRHS